jgi:hypothetical protein
MFPFQDIAFASMLQALGTVLWFVVPAFLFAIFWDLRLTHKRLQFMGKVKWVMLEIRVPKDNIKPTKSMEQFIANLWGIYSFGVKPLDKYLDGKVDLWISFELVGQGGGIAFYIRTPAQYRNLVESSLYAQYPDVEIVEAPDYTDELPAVMPNETYDLFGAGYKLTQPNPYPIRTYANFDDTAMNEAKRLDALAPIFEAMSKLKDEERIWIQLLISPTGKPTGDDMRKEGEDLVKKIQEEKSKKNADGTSGGLSGIYQEAIKGIESKISKPCFQVSFRFMYIDRRDSFSGLNQTAVMGAMQQFNTQNMNGLAPDRLITIAGGLKMKLFPAYKQYVILSKKRMLYDYYVNRRFGYSNRLAEEKLPVLNTEEIATLFHFPHQGSKAPSLRRITSRRSEPPVNLPIEE